MKKLGITAILLAAITFTGTTQAQVGPPPFTPNAYLKADNTGALDTFGTVVAISGNTAVVGAPGEDSAATNVNGDGADNTASEAGAAYVYVKTGDVWTFQAYLKPRNAEAGDMFGSSVAISGDLIVVGAPMEDSRATGVNGNRSDNSEVASGAAYVFNRSGTSWRQRAYLKASNTEGGDLFGSSVAIAGNTIVVGAPNEDSSDNTIDGNQLENTASAAGAAYVFTRNSGVWSQQAYLKADNIESNDRFGSAVAVDGDTVVVSSLLEDSASTGVGADGLNNNATDSGAAYVFFRVGGVWSQQAYLKASNTESLDQFGKSLAISGETIVVGNPFDASDAMGVNGDDQNNKAAKTGSAYVFVRNINVWAQQAYLKASNANGSDEFGGDVDVSGDTIIVGAISEDSGARGVNGNQQHNSVASSGAAYVFVRSGMMWNQQGYLKASNTEFTDVFGHAVGVSGDNAIVTAEGEDSSGLELMADPDDNLAGQAGAAYTFNVPTMLEPAVIIRTIAGNGTSLADDILASDAQFAGVRGIAIDTSDNLFVSDAEGHRVRVIDSTNGLIATIAGTGDPGFSGDGAAGPTALLSTPRGISYDDNLKRIVISDSVNERIRAFNLLNGLIATIGGNGTNGQSGDGGPAVAAEISTPSGIVAHPDGSIYFSTASNTVRRIDPAGNISTVAGNGTNGFSGDMGLATEAMLNTPTGMAFDNFANLFIADSGNHRIRRVDAQTGIITTYAGTGAENFSGDLGLAIDAELDTPGYIAFAANGDLYFTDSGNQVIRYIERDSQVIRTFAGSPRKTGFTGDGGHPLLARLNEPAGLAFDSLGNLYVADRNNQRIRKIEQLPLSVFDFQDLLPGQSIPLFTNNHLIHFEDANGGQVRWQLAASNVLEVVPGNGNVVTKRDFNAFHLHAEFKLPNDGSDGNSGIYLQSRYEIQIFNSFGKPVPDNNDCGAIWGQVAPQVNACLAPGEWQSLEITFHPAQWNNSTNKVSNARVTVALNGTLLHSNVEITSSTQGGVVETNTPGPILFQNHGTRVQFRNIVITPFDTAPRFDWVRTAGSTNALGIAGVSEMARAVSSDRMGNVYVVGGFEGRADFGSTNVVQSAGGTDAFLAKYSANGDLQWVVPGGGPGLDLFMDVAVAPDGTVVVGGGTDTNANYSGSSLVGAGSLDAIVAKYDADGSLQWIRSVGNTSVDVTYGVAVDGAGDIFVTGEFTGINNYPDGSSISSAFGTTDAFVARYRPDGSVVWVRSGGGLLLDRGNDVVPDGAGGAYFAGQVGSSASFGPIQVAGAGNEEAFAAHVDGAGFYRWMTNSTSFGGSQRAESIERAENGDLYISGTFTGGFVFGQNTLSDSGQPATHDIFIAKLSPLGRPDWLRQVAGEGDDGQSGVELAVDQQGGIYLAGAIGGNTTFSSLVLTTNGQNNLFLAKYASNGDAQWARSARGFGVDGAPALDVSPSGNIILGGFLTGVTQFDDLGLSTRGGADIFVSRLGSTLSQLPISQWRFDDTNMPPAVADSFGAFNGMLSSTGAVYTGGGFSTNAVSIDSADNGYVNFGNVPLTGLEPLTISVAIRIDASQTNHMVVLSQHDANFNRGLIIGVNGMGTNAAPGKVFFTDTGRFGDAIVSLADVVDGRWHSVVITYQPYGVKALYVDGVQQAFAGANLFPPADAPLVAGGLSAGGVPFGLYSGLLDELVIYRRVLSAEEIEVQSIYPDEQIEPFVPDAFEWVRQGFATNIIATAVTTDANGDIYVVGGYSGTAEFGTNAVSSQAFFTDAFIAKYNSQGDILWVRTGGGNGTDIANDVVVDSDGFIIVGGNYESTATFGGLFLVSGGGGGGFFEAGFVAKYTADGTIVRLIDGWGAVNAVAVDSDKNMYAAGSGRLFQTRNGIQLSAVGGRDLWLAKYDFVGSVQWARNYGGTGDEGIDAMDVTGDGNIFVTGEFESGIFNIASTTLFQQGNTQGQNEETFVIRIDSSVGDPVWAQQGVGLFEQINDSFLDTQGRYNIVGTTFGSLNFQAINIASPSSFAGFRAAFSQFGAPLLGQSYMQEMKGMATSGTNNVYVFGEIFNSNSVMLAGQTLSSRGQADSLLLKINDQGTNQFVRQIGGQGDDNAARGNSVAIDPSGNVYLVGYSDNNNGAPIQFENLASVPDTRSSAWLVKAPSEVQILRHPTDLVATNLDSTFFRV
ncbi:MAG: family 16 glycoside hydrolase, partial [Limisphaerales bacterium]